jgi:hypothetical protein
MAKTASATKVVTGKARLSYVHVFEPFSSIEGQEPKYSCVLLIPKSDKVTIKKLRAAQQAALEQGKDSRFNGRIPKDWKDTIRDGDEDFDLEKNPEYEGNWVLSVSSKTKPGVVDQDVNPIIDSTEVYSGVYARASINAFPYAVSGSKGVSFGLNHLQKLADGDFLGGRSKAEDDFTAIERDDEDDDDLI